jgi:methyl-accepting chemotaxis protein
MLLTPDKMCMLHIKLTSQTAEQQSVVIEKLQGSSGADVQARKNRNVVTQIRILLGVLIGVFCLSSAFSFKQQLELQKTVFNLHANAAPFQSISVHIQATLYRARMLVLNGLTTLDAERSKVYIADAGASLEKVNKLLTQLETESQFEAYKASTEQVRLEFKNYTAIVSGVLEKVKAGDKKGAEEEVDTKCYPQFEKLRGLVSKMAEQASENSEQEMKNLASESEGSVRVATFSLIAFLFIAFGGSIWGPRLISKSVGNVAQSTQEVHSRINETSESLQVIGLKLTNESSALAAGVEQINASLEEMTSNLGLDERSASDLKTLSEKSAESANLAFQGIEKLSQTVTQIDLDSKKIKEMCTSINGVAFQTNLLALNASVEAARAGEHGRGFAVVADAVRQLAARTAEIAGEIQKITQTSTNQSASGVIEAASCKLALENITTSVEKFREASTALSERILQQHMALKQITAAVTTSDIAAQNAADSSQKLHNDSETLHMSLQDMSGNIKQLHSLIGSKEAA